MTPKAKRKLASLGVGTMGELVGKRVRLKRRLTTVGKTVFEEGSILEVCGTWRGRVNLQKPGPVPDGEQNDWPRITHVALWDIEEPQPRSD